MARWEVEYTTDADAHRHKTELDAEELDEGAALAAALEDARRHGFRLLHPALADSEPIASEWVGGAALQIVRVRKVAP